MTTVLVCEVCLREVSNADAVFAHRDLSGSTEDLGFGPSWGAAAPCHPGCRPGLLHNPYWQTCLADD